MTKYRDTYFDPFKEIDARFNIVEAFLKVIIDKLDAPTEKHWVTRKMIKEKYHISYGTIHNAMKRGTLKFKKIGSKTLFNHQDVNDWLLNNK